MRTIWAKLLLPHALKSCPKCNKSPNLITLIICREAAAVKARSDPRCKKQLGKQILRIQKMLPLRKVSIPVRLNSALMITITPKPKLELTLSKAEIS